MAYWTIYRALLPESSIPYVENPFRISDLLHIAIELQTNGQRCACRSCGQRSLQKRLNLHYSPPMLAIELQPDPRFQWIDLRLEQSIDMNFLGSSVHYTLIGVVYLGSAHFTCRYRDPDDTWWIYDDTRTQGVAQRDTQFLSSIGGLKTLGSSQACLFVYSKQ